MSFKEKTAVNFFVCGCMGGMKMMAPANPPFLPKERRSALPINVVVSDFVV